MVVNINFWKHQRVLITGHTGFKGAWLSLWLQKLQANLCGIALSPSTQPNLFSLASVDQNMQSHIVDIRDFDQINKIIHNFKPEIIIHMAAQPLVRYSYQHPIETYATNVMGTVHLLESAKVCDSVQAVVNITTDKCYENKEWMWGYRENETLGGHDPYSNSKACSELVTSAYRNSFYEKLNKGLSSARAGNVIGGGDWSEDRLIADVVKSFVAKKPVIIRNPNAIRPWQHVLEPLFGYLLLAEKLIENKTHYSQAWNFGPFSKDAISVEMVVKKILARFKDNQIGFVIEQNSEAVHEARSLRLDITKAAAGLSWSPKLTIDETIAWTVDWYQAWLNKVEMRAYTLQQIQQYQDICAGNLKQELR